MFKYYLFRVSFILYPLFIFITLLVALDIKIKCSLCFIPYRLYYKSIPNRFTLQSPSCHILLNCSLSGLYCLIQGHFKLYKPCFNYSEHSKVLSGPNFMILLKCKAFPLDQFKFYIGVLKHWASMLIYKNFI